MRDCDDVLSAAMIAGEFNLTTGAFVERPEIQRALEDALIRQGPPLGPSECQR